MPSGCLTGSVEGTDVEKLEEVDNNEEAPKARGDSNVFCIGKELFRDGRPCEIEEEDEEDEEEGDTTGGELNEVVGRPSIGFLGNILSVVIGSSRDGSR